MHGIDGETGVLDRRAISSRDKNKEIKESTFGRERTRRAMFTFCRSLVPVRDLTSLASARMLMMCALCEIEIQRERVTNEQLVRK
jgi:hypothetical protein